MNTRSLLILAGATAVVAVVAAVTLHHGESAVQETPAAGKLFPAFAASLNNSATVELKKKDGVTTLRKSADSWGLAEKNGYPVDMSAVRKTLIGLSELTATEARTEDPKLYAKLGVEDPDAEGSTSTLLTVKDEAGKELASLIVGKEHAGKSFTAHQVYVRKPGEKKSWLANGDLALKEKGADWLDKKILEVKRERVRAVEIRHADGEVVAVDRDKPDTKDFTLHDVPDGKELTYPSAPTSVADALGYLNLEDVVPAESMDMKEGVACTSKFTCFDGLTITVLTKDAGEKTYARFEASYEAPLTAAGPSPAPETKPGEPKDPSQASTPDSKDSATKEGAPKTDEKPKAKTAEEVQKEVSELNARLSKWVYQIPSYNKSSFEKKKAELLKDKVTPPPEAPKTETTPETEPTSSEGKAPEPTKPPSDTKPSDEGKPPGDSKPPQEDAKPEPPKPPRGA